MSESLYEKHAECLSAALKAIEQRSYYSAYPEIPSGKIYGETAKKDGEEAFKALLNSPFELKQPGMNGRIGAEHSPFGFALGVDYPKCELDELMPSVAEVAKPWGLAPVRLRVGTCLEILKRLNMRSFEIANAIMHTTGQSFMMAFQAGGPHAQDRGLEALAYAYREMTRVPEQVTWKKQVGKDQFVTLDKTYHIIPRGVALTIGCSTFPTWNGYPGIFASLATGNAVVVKPHPGAILPLAITVRVVREVLEEQGFDPNVATLLVDSPEDPITKEAATRPEVGIVDYTGGPDFGRWVEEHARHAQVYTEKAGVNSVILDSVDDLKAVTGNLAFSTCLYSGQMCTAPQNIFIPKDGICVSGDQVGFSDVVKSILGAIDWLIGDAKRGADILGAIQSERTLARVEEVASQGGEVVRASDSLPNEAFPEARTRSPLVISVKADQRELYMREAFGPILYIIATESTDQSIALAAETAEHQGAITASVYSTDASVQKTATHALIAKGAAVSMNLTGQIFVNQSAAFSDFHVSGANPAGNATLCDGAFVANRFRVIQSRVLV